MTLFEELLYAEGYYDTIEIREKSTGKTGVANSKNGMVEVFYGADDGSDTKVISPEEFERDFDITAKISDWGKSK